MNDHQNAAGIEATIAELLRIAIEHDRKAAAGNAATTRRRVHEDFAVAALEELAQAGRALLIPYADGTPEEEPAR